MLFCVAVSGGIASGKSTVCSLLQQAGAALVDADVVARELVTPGQPALQEIAEQLGQRFIQANGELDRMALRAHVFSDANAKQTLEHILHPRIQTELKRQCSGTSSAPYILVAIPLLSPESRQHAYAWIQRVLIVEASEQTQIERIAKRDNCTPELAQAMVQAQLRYSQRLPMADDVLINDGNMTHLQGWAERLHARYSSSS